LRPTRILHVVEPGAGDEGVLACRAALSIPGVEHLVWVIGSDAQAARAAELGVASSSRIVPPLGVPELAARRYSNLVWDRFWRPGRGSPGDRTPDIQMCWSIHAAGLTRAAMGNRAMLRLCALLRSPAGERRRGSLASKRMAYALSHAQPIALHRSLREDYARAASKRRGGLYSRENIRLFAPPVPIRPEIVDPDEKSELRRELGIPSDAYSVVLLADPPNAADANRFAFLLGLVFAAHVRVCGIVPGGVGPGRSGIAHLNGGGAHRTQRAAHFLRDHNRRWGMSITGWPLERSLRAADVAVLLTPDPTIPSSTDSAGPTSLTLAMALGVPIFSAFSPMARDTLGTKLADLCVAKAASSYPINDAAGRLIPALGDAVLLHELQSTALRRAQLLADEDAFRRDLLAIWDEMTHRPRAREGLPVPPALRDPTNEPVLLDS
jgi:hypothetical protein